MKNFDPNSAASEESGIFGLPFNLENASLVLLPVPWEVTTSYGGGTAKGPRAILEASKQVDLFDFHVLRPYEPGIFCLSESAKVKAWNKEGRSKAASIIEVGGDIGTNKKLLSNLRQVNALSEKLNAYVFSETSTLLKKKKTVAILGGDHSVPFGAFKAAAEHFGEFGILHFDAHSDTRMAYEGFVHSHASILYNTLEEIPEVKKLVQVGIRDFCEEEWQYIHGQGTRALVYFDADLKQRTFAGVPWKKTAEEIVSHLPKKVWISFDIDGLDPKLCPGTGTPVPGGLEFSETIAIFAEVVRSGREIIGFDLVEVAPTAKSEWDANVGARLLYKLLAFTFASKGQCELR